MIGLNWFALSLNSKECVVRVETLPAGENPPKAIRGLDHRSVIDPDRHELRWGLILNYRTGQRFIINLSDPILRQLSLNKRVIRVSDDHELDESALLAGVVDDIVRLVHSDGSATEERASDWTPQ